MAIVIVLPGNFWFKNRLTRVAIIMLDEITIRLKKAIFLKEIIKLLFFVKTLK
jgi:hypothetical protein